MNLLNQLRELIEFNLTDFLNTNWSVVQFKQQDFAVRAAILLGAAFLLKFLWPYLRQTRDKSFYEHSGYRFEPQDKPGFWDKILGLIPMMFVILASGLLLTAIAKPASKNSCGPQW